MNAQIVSYSPAFPTDTDIITITYDATQGNAALLGESPVYMHTGVITNLSAPGQWFYDTPWGVNSANTLMTDIGNNKHEISFHVRNFYGVPMSETILELAFVFRNSDGSKVGKTATEGDIFIPVFSNSSQLLGNFSTPGDDLLIVSTSDVIPITAVSSINSTLTIFDNGTQIAQGTGTELMHNLTVNGTGNHTVTMTAEASGMTVSDTFTYVINPTILTQNPPAGTELGINYLSPSSVRLQLYAPNKNNVYVIGDFNNWEPDVNYFMNRGTDNATWWIELTGLTPGQEYAFQYLVDGDLKIADPYSEVILDPNNDQWIPSSTYPNLHPYPDGLTTGIVSLLQPGKTPYNWQTTNFQRPEKTDMVVYELLIRDFVGNQNYQTLMDSLDYLETLGVNVIELMPINEFEGNNSWGYNPSFHMALDKYYGTADDFKAFIDAAHSRGIAVVADVVYNHAFSQSPFAQLYWNSADFVPAADNPWLNEYPKHGFNVGSDFNHEAQATKDFVDRVMKYWLTEFRLDGFRFDLAKGFTQNQTCDNTGGNCDIGGWAAYDASRVALIKRMADVMWAASPDSYMILEHFTDNSEEQDLSNYGILIWGNGNHDYNEGSMGYNSNLNWYSYQSRGWSDPHLVTFMESHDEERLMYKNLEFGNNNGNYNVKDLTTALARQELVGSFFFTIPGPKMIWQFGELGYDESINLCSDGVTIDPNCRLDEKPLHWEYLQENDRNRLYHVYKALIDLKDYDTFRTTNYSMDVGSATKRINLNHSAMNATVIGNFNVVPNSIDPNFQHTGTWYNYFTGASIQVNNVNDQISLDPGEYHIYTDQPLPVPVLSSTMVGNENLSAEVLENLTVYPNPATDKVFLNYMLSEAGTVKISLLNLMGQKVANLLTNYQASGDRRISFEADLLDAGVYFISVETEHSLLVEKLIIQ